MALLTASLPAGCLIPVETRSLALVFSTDAHNHLTQPYVGPASGVPAGCDSAGVQDDAVYPTANSVFYSQPALRATHSDGNTSTDLVYVRHETQDLGPEVALTKILLKDSYYPFFVDVFVRAYKADDAFVEWTEVHHQETGDVILYEVASAGVVLHAASYRLTHFSRDQGNRLSLCETDLTPLLEFLKSVGATGRSRATEPVFVVSLGEGKSPAGGAALAGMLLTGGDFVNSFEYEETDQIFPYRSDPVITGLRILGSDNPRNRPRALPPGKTLVTPPLVLTYHDQGMPAARTRLSAWAQAHAKEHETGVIPPLDEQ